MPRVSDHVVNTLARVMADAKAGSVEAVAIVTVDGSGQPRVHFGGAGDLAPSIYLGAGMIQGTIMAQVVEAPGAAQMHSGLIVPGIHG